MPSLLKDNSKLIALCFAFSLLGIVELGLRKIGTFTNTAQQPSAPLNWESGAIEAAGQIQSAYLQEEAGVVNLGPQARQFMKTPPFQVTPTKRRIFSFGGSATLGVPVENQPEQTFPGQISSQLEALNIQVESINLGGASFGSDHVLQLVEESLPYSPSALLIYSGNNEFFNFGLALTKQNKNWKPGQRYLESLHIFRGIRHLMGKGPSTIDLNPEQLKFSQDEYLGSLIQGMMNTQGNNIHWDNGIPIRKDEITTVVSTRYHQNMLDIANLAGDVPVFIAEVPPNLFEPPWLSLHHPNSSQAVRRQFKTLLEKASSQNCTESLSLWKELTKLDSWRADGWYGLGSCQYELKTPYQQALKNALILDMYPGRPPPSLHKALKGIEGVEIIRLGDFDEENEFGRDYFHDSCHLNPKGYQVLAKAFRNALISLGWGF
jgi:lysophospholipase L1-like esterase